MSKEKKGNVTDYQSLFRLYRKGSEVFSAIQHTGKETIDALSWLTRGMDVEVIDEVSDNYILCDEKKCFLGDYIVFSNEECYVVAREEFEREYVNERLSKEE